MRHLTFQSWSKGFGLLILLSIASLGEATIYVSKQGSDLNSGADWAHAKASIQTAIDVSVVGDQIWVGKGSYDESITVENGRKLYGSFAGTETDPSQRNMTANATVLVQSDDLSMYVPPDCGPATTIDGFVFDSVGTLDEPLDNSDLECWGSPTFSNCLITGTTYTNYAPVRIFEGSPKFAACTFSGNNMIVPTLTTPRNFLIEIWSPTSFSQCKFSNNLTAGTYAHAATSFTLCSITNNRGYAVYAEGGGGILFLSCVISSSDEAFSANSPLTVKNTTFQHNTGGLTSRLATMDIESCQFTNFTASSIGPVRCGGRLFLTDSLFLNNTMTDGLGAVSGLGTIQRCVFTGNTSSVSGGAISTGTDIQAASGVVKDCLFMGNSCAQQGSAVDVFGWITVANCTFVNNSGGVSGGGGTICIELSNVPFSTTPTVVANNIIFANYSGGIASLFSTPVSLDRNDFYGDVNFEYQNCGPGPTDSHVDPKFFNPANGDCHLSSASPMIGVGNTAYVANKDRDLDGAARLTNGAVSIGAYEPLPVSITGLTASSVVGGFATPATVTLSIPAYYGLVVAFLESNASGAVSIPFPTGARTATLDVPTVPVAANTTITLSVVYGNSIKSTSLLVKAPSMVSVQLPVSLIGGNPGTGTVNLNAPLVAPGAVSLTSSASSLVVPATVNGSGAASQSFAFTTGGVAASSVVTVTATFNGTQAHASMTLLPADMTTMIVGSKTVKGGGRVAGYIYLNGMAPPAGAVVALTTDSPSLVTITPTATVKGGTTNGSYAIQTSTVTAKTVVHITAKYRSVTVTVALEIDP
jgi:predicted outer membrane repeat protein